MMRAVVCLLVSLGALSSCGDDDGRPAGGVGGATGPTASATSAASVTSGGGGGGGGGAGGGGSSLSGCSVDDGTAEHIVGLAVGDKTSVALSSLGRVACWGETQYGQCGPAGEGWFHVPPRWIPGLACAKQVDTNLVGFALRDDATIVGWGTEFQEELGDGPGSSGAFAELVDVILPGAPTDVASDHTGGNGHVDGRVVLWGRTWPDIVWPEGRFWDAEPGTEVYRGGPTLCEVSADGTARCLGRNDTGCVGDGSLEPRDEFVEVSTDARFRALQLRYNISCGITLDGEVYCWGDNAWGGLGVGIVPPLTTPKAERAVPVPTRLEGLGDIVMIDLAESGGCALDDEGAVFCWGRNISERFVVDEGDAVNDVLAEPKRIEDLSPAVAVAVGDRHVCVLRDDGTVWCRGDNLLRGEDVTTPGATQVPFAFDEEP